MVKPTPIASAAAAKGKSPAALAPIRRGSRSAATAREAGKMAERLVVAYTRSRGGRHAERRLAGSTKDRGDIAGVPGVVIEVKSPGPNSPIELGPWLEETLTERDNDGAAIGLLVVKRRNRGSPADWYWITDGATMTRLLNEAGWLAS
jgi:hypothetical protein